jgi:hypothetical protein
MLVSHHDQENQAHTKIISGLMICVADGELDAARCGELAGQVAVEAHPALTAWGSGAGPVSQTAGAVSSRG